MLGYRKRNIEEFIAESIENNPVIAILGPRQCGKSTLAKELLKNNEDSLYLDLQKNSDLRKLDDAELFFQNAKGKLVCLDEIQLKPELFPLIRSMVDETNANGQILILGSASRDLIKQSSETLAGRIGYSELTPFTILEVDSSFDEIRNLWDRGGFPRSYLSKSDRISFNWRKDFIRTFLERDIPQFGNLVQTNVISRLWSMLAHIHGQVLNMARLSNSLDVSANTIKTYIELLEQTFMVRTLKPYETNLKKRLVKSPKIYIRDTGILHALLNINDFNDLLGHIVIGNSWEGFVIENILAELPDCKGYFYRTAAGAEIDLILEKGNKKVAVECKSSMAPNISKGFYSSLEDLEIEEGYIIAPVKDSYPVKKNVFVMPLPEFVNKMKKKFK